MSFMQRQVVLDDWFEIDTTYGTFWVPESLAPGMIDEEEMRDQLAQYVDGTILRVERKRGWGARLSAPGYMDCTDWSVYDTKEQAEEALEDMYGT